MAKKSLSEFYRDLLELIVAVIIAQSFFQADAYFIPLSKITSTAEGAIDAAGIFMAYFIVISGWVGYYRSVTKEPHKETVFGNLRFVIDLVIVFFTYYIVSIASPKSDAHFNEIFLWVLPLIFILYLIWDGIKFVEYYSNRSTRNIRFRRLGTTAIFAGLFVLQSVGYGLILHSYGSNGYPYPTKPAWNKTVFDMYFIITTLFGVFFYRWLKWNKPEKLPKKAGTGKKAKTDESPSA